MNGLSNLKELRESRGLTQTDLAEMLFITPQSISKWENGLNEPDIDTLCRLADIFEVSIDTLIGRCELYKKDLINKFKAYIKESKNITDDLFDILKCSVSVCLGGEGIRETNSYILENDSLITHYSNGNTPHVFLIANKLSNLICENKELKKYISIIADKYVIDAVKCFDKLEKDVYYDEESFCNLLKIPYELANELLKKLVYIKVIEMTAININTREVLVYRKLNCHMLLSIYAYITHVFLSPFDGSKLIIS